MSPRAESASALHVHVNVRHADARGDALSAAELLAVWASWVRFDLVTLFLARSWYRTSQYPLRWDTVEGGRNKLADRFAATTMLTAWGLDDTEQ